MKLLIVVAALLVASVAGQTTLDLLKLNKDSNILFKYDRPLVGRDLLWRQRLLGHPLERNLIYGDNIEVPSYLRDEILDVPVYGLDEIVVQPLFREYLRLPLFRQYFQYPSFQRYVASVYFQRFWQVETFQQYFINPVLFYKYIYPIVTLFHNEYNLPTYNYNNQIYGQGNLYKQDVFDDATYYNNHNTVEDLYKNRNDFVAVAPFAYNHNYYNYNRDQVYAQSLLEKIYKHLNVKNNVNTVGRLNEIHTEVQLTPEGEVRQETYGKIVDPVTGEARLTVGDAELVDEKIIPVPVDTTFQGQDRISSYNIHDRYNYNVYPTINRVNPLVRQLLHGYNYDRVPVNNRF